MAASLQHGFDQAATAARALFSRIRRSRWTLAWAMNNALLIGALTLRDQSDGPLPPAQAWHLSALMLVPFAVLYLVSLLPSSIKAALVYLRVWDILPGHRAFSEYAAKTPWIDLDMLRRRVGPFPRAPRAQSALWHRLYRQVETHPAVRAARRRYAAFRDITVLSLLLGFIVPPLLLDARVDGALIWLGLKIYFVIYACWAIRASNAGVRLVAEVLALHAMPPRHLIRGEA